jgi:ERCC4-related helicase
VLIATDCISEGQNLQDCDYLINYDIHWNPVRLIQRFVRIRPQRRLEMRINEMYFKIKSCLSIGIQLGQC